MLYSLQFAGRYHSSEYQLFVTGSSINSIWMQVSWIYGKSVIRDTIIKSVPRFPKIIDRYMYFYLFLVTGTFHSNIGVDEILGNSTLPLNDNYFLSLEFCTFSILGHAFSSICQANVAWIGIVHIFRKILKLCTKIIDFE